MKKQDQLKAALPKPCQNLEKMSQKADVSGQAGAVTRGASCPASTTQRSGYKDITPNSARARLDTLLLDHCPSAPPEFPAANVALSHSDSPVDVPTQSCAVTRPSKTDKLTAVTDSVTSGTIEKTSLAKTCASVCLACGGTLPPPGTSQPCYLQYVTGYCSNSCPYGMWVGGPYHMSAGGVWSSSCGPCGACGSCGSCGPCGTYAPCGSYTSCGPYAPCSLCNYNGPSAICGSCCYCPAVPNYNPNTQTCWSTPSVPIAQGTPEIIEVPEIPDIPVSPPMTSCGTQHKPKTDAVGDDFPEFIHDTSMNEGVPGVVCFTPEESAKKKKNRTNFNHPSFDNPLPSTNRNKPILNRPTKLT